MAGPSVRMARTIGANSPRRSRPGAGRTRRVRERGRQDRRVGGVEPDVEEGRTEESRKSHGRDDDRDGVAHDPSPGATTGPPVTGVRETLRTARRSTRGPRMGQDRRQERQRRGDRQGHDDGAGDPDRAQDHELEEDQAEQPKEHGQPAEEDRPAGRRDGDPDRIGRRETDRRAGARAPRGSGWSTAGSSPPRGPAPTGSRG